MHELARMSFTIGVLAFMASLAVTVWNLARLHLALRRDGGLSLRRARKIFDTRNQIDGYPEARRCIWSMRAAAISWCVSFAIGLGAGILH